MSSKSCRLALFVLAATPQHSDKLGVLSTKHYSGVVIRSKFHCQNVRPMGAAPAKRKRLRCLKSHAAPAEAAGKARKNSRTTLLCYHRGNHIGAAPLNPRLASAGPARRELRKSAGNRTRETGGRTTRGRPRQSSIASREGERGCGARSDSPGLLCGDQRASRLRGELRWSTR